MSEPREWQILKFIVRLVIALLLVLLVASTSSAGMAVIETTMSVENDSQQSVNAAFREAARVVVRGVMAMGFAWVQLLEALVRDDTVIVRILATDSEPAADAPEAYQVSGRPGPGEFVPSESFAPRVFSLTGFRFLPDCLDPTSPVIAVSIPCESSM